MIPHESVRVELTLDGLKFADYTIQRTQENPLDDIYEVKTTAGGGPYGHVIRQHGETFEALVARAMQLLTS